MYKNDDLSRQINEMVSRYQKLSYRQIRMQLIIRLGFHLNDTIELRLRSNDSVNIFEHAQIVANLFLTTFGLYPQILVVHPTVVAMFEAAKFGIVAKHVAGEEVLRKLCGQDLPMPPLKIWPDATLDLQTVAVRWKLPEEDIPEDAIQMILDTLKIIKKE